MTFFAIPNLPERRIFNSLKEQIKKELNEKELI